MFDKSHLSTFLLLTNLFLSDIIIACRYKQQQHIIEEEIWKM